jgi:hypothetical protein
MEPLFLIGGFLIIIIETIGVCVLWRWRRGDPIQKPTPTHTTRNDATLPPKTSDQKELNRVLFHVQHIEEARNILAELTSVENMGNKTATRAQLLTVLGQRCIMELIARKNYPYYLQEDSPAHDSFVVRKHTLRNRYIPSTIKDNPQATLHIEKISRTWLNNLLLKEEFKCKIIIRHVIMNCGWDDLHSDLGPPFKRTNVQFGPFVESQTRDLYRPYLMAD